jgi:hypothetical protein
LVGDPTATPTSRSTWSDPWCRWRLAGRRRATERPWPACRGVGGWRDLCEFLLPLAARALADQAEAARDTGMADSAVLAELRSLTERFPDVVTDPGQPTPLMIIQRSAMSAWYAAEIGRARQSAGSGERWLKTAALFKKGWLPG